MNQLRACLQELWKLADEGKIVSSGFDNLRYRVALEWALKEEARVGHSCVDRDVTDQDLEIQKHERIRDGK